MLLLLIKMFLDEKKYFRFGKHFFTHFHSGNNMGLKKQNENLLLDGT